MTIVKPIFSEYPQHRDALIEAALTRVDPQTAVQRHMQRQGTTLTIGERSFDLTRGRVFLVSVGKAAEAMGQAAVEVLQEHLTAGIFITKKRPGVTLAADAPSPFINQQPALLILAGAHPVPDEDSLQATTAVTALLSQATADDLVLCLISGGASALLTQPLIPLADWQQLIQQLLTSGCSIHELNCVRQQLDRVKGGGLAQIAHPARCVSLILSDVVGNSVSVIGSGPTALSSQTAADALAVLQRYEIPTQLESAVWQRIEQALSAAGEANGPHELQTDHLIVGDVRQAATAVLTKATQLGFLAHILTTHLEGEAREVGRMVAALAKDLPSGHCLILGGETTVTLRGEGQGGRNQEAALAAALAFAGWPGVVVITLATDGEDGPTDAAGAVVTGETAVVAHAHHLDAAAYLDQNDSYTFFKQLDQANQPPQAATAPLLEPESEPEDDQADTAAEVTPTAEPAEEETADFTPEQELLPNTPDPPVGTSPPHLLKTGVTGTNVNDLILILSYDNDGGQ